MMVPPFALRLTGFPTLASYFVNSAGHLFDSTDSRYNRQTFNMPGTASASAGDPIGTMLPAQAAEEITNRLIWTDGFSQSTYWTATNVTVTANTKNDSGVGNTDGASPVADTLNATSASGSISQSYTCTADTAVRTASIDLEAGTATNSTLSLVYTGGNTYTANIAWSGGAPTVTHGGSAGASDVGATLQATGIYKIWVRGANDGRTTAALTLLPAAGGTGTVFASRAQINDGSEVLAYQPNAGCLGGSNRRSGGANQWTWSQDVANPAWTKSSCSAADDGTITATAAAAIHSVTNTSIVTASGIQYTVWYDVEYTNYAFLQIYINSNAGAGHINYDIQNGTLSATTATGAITNIGTNRYRISLTYTASGTDQRPLLIFVTGTSAARAESWTPAGTETFKFIRAFRGFGSSLGTYTRNMGVLGGLITNVPLYQTTSGNRPLLARFPKTGIRNQFTTTTATFSTRTFTTQAVQYTLSFKGTGTVTLSGTSTAGPLVGTGANNRVSLTFTPTAGTLTLTLSGSATEAQIEFGASATTYQDVVSASDITETGVGYNYLPLYDGTSDFMTLGMQSWGTTQLLAAAQYAFTIFFVFRTVSANAGGIISQNNGAAAAAMMFSLFVGSSTGAIGLNSRGTAATAWGSDNRDGVFHVGALRWNGTSFDQILDNGSLTAVTWAGGSLAATAIDIAVGMERVSTAARPFNGHLGVAFIDRACTDAEMLSAVRSLNATYRAGL